LKYSAARKGLIISKDGINGRDKRVVPLLLELLHEFFDVSPLPSFRLFFSMGVSIFAPKFSPMDQNQNDRTTPSCHLQ